MRRIVIIVLLAAFTAAALGFAGMVKTDRKVKNLQQSEMFESRGIPGKLKRTGSWAY